MQVCHSSYMKQRSQKHETHGRIPKCTSVKRERGEGAGVINGHCIPSCTLTHANAIGGSSAGAPGARTLSECFYGCIIETRINFILINMQCLQYVFYSLLSLQKHRVCVKGHQNNLQTSKIIPCPQVLKFLDPPQHAYLSHQLLCKIFFFWIDIRSLNNIKKDAVVLIFRMPIITNGLFHTSLKIY